MISVKIILKIPHHALTVLSSYLRNEQYKNNITCDLS